MFERLSLNYKLTVVLAAFLAIGVVNSLIIYSVVTKQKASARAINLAGRQRMLTQKMSKEAFILTTVAAGEEAEVRKSLEATAHLFEATLKGLLQGDASQGLEPVEDGDTKRKLIEVRGLWEPFHAAIDVIINKGAASDEGREALAYIKANNIKLLKTMNEAVGLYERSSSPDTVLVIQGVLFLCLLVITALAWLFSRLKIIKPLREAAATLDDSSFNMTGLSSSVSSAAMNIAEEASSLAATAEESSASLEEITSMTRQNAEHTGKANEEMRATKAIAEKATKYMKEMNRAMDEILAAGEETQKIVSTIDGIAFQTNLLSLNASVEAARAGEAGAGFAVVADEVRNLAMRSAESARSTSELIENIVQRIEDGSSLVREATSAFEQVAQGADKVAVLIDEISKANDEQVIGISQISDAINETDRMSQQNAAISEEAASAAADMSNEAAKLNDIVGHLTSLIDGNGESRGRSRPAAPQAAGVSGGPDKAGTPLLPAQG